MPDGGSSVSFSLIVPTYNEADNILILLQQVQAVLGSRSHEVIVVDDNSSDQTWKRVEDYAASGHPVRVIRRMDQRSLSSAVLAGFDIARGKILGVMDADLSHDEKVLPALITAVEQGADIAVGSRRVPGGGATNWPWYRRLSSNFATGLTKLLLPLPMSDPMSGFFVLKRSIVDRCRERLRPTGYKVLVEICCKAGPTRIKEVPFIFKDRTQGQSKLSGTVMKQYIQMLFMLKLDRLVQWVRYTYHTGRYRKVKAWLNEGNVLDIGCGQPCETMPDGAFLRFLGRGTGVDIKPCQGPFTFLQGSVLDLPVETSSFDNVVAMEILEHVTDSHKAFSEITRVVRDDGRVIISVPEETWLWGMIWEIWENSFGFMWHHTHEGTQPLASWLRILSQYFEIEAQQRHWHFDRIFKLRKRK